MSRGKAYLDSLERVDRMRDYDATDAVNLLKEISKTKFDETVEAVFNLGVDPRHADQMVRGTVMLPHGTGKTVRVLVFAKGEKAIEAQEGGADFVGAVDLVDKVKGGWLGFDAVVATPDMMRDVGKLGSVLGPRKLMPSPKTGTVTNDVVKAVNELKGGKIEYRVEKNGIIHAILGKVSFTTDQIVENLTVVFEAIMRAKPSAAKGTYLKKLTLSSTMGPGIKINHATLA